MNKKYLILGLIILIHSIFVIHSLGQPFHGDEIVFLEAARGVLDTGKPIFDQGILNPGWQGLWHPPLYIYLLSLFMKFFGNSIYVVRSVSALFNAGVILLVYFITKELLKENRKKEFFAILTCALYAFNPFVIQSSVPLDIDAGVLNFSIYLFLFLWVKEKNYFYLIPSLIFVFFSKENGVVTLFLGMFLTSLVSMNFKETKKTIVLFLISGLIFVFLFYIYAQALDLNFFMPFKQNYPIFSEHKSDLIHLSLTSWAKSVWAFNNFFYFSIPFFVILFSIASIHFYYHNWKNLKKEKIVVFNLLALITIGLFSYLAANSWGFPKYYITAMPAMCIFLVYWFSKIKDGNYFNLNYKKIAIFIVLTLILTLYFLNFMKDPLYPKLDSTTSNTNITYAIKMMIETVLLYIIIPFAITFLTLLIFRIKKTMCHHTLKCVVCDRHLFLGCSEIKTSKHPHLERCGLISDIKNKLIWSLICLIFFFMIYINLLHFQVDYSTYYNYGDRGVLETVDYIKTNNISSNTVAAYPHIGSYLGIGNYYEITFLYSNKSLFKEKLVDNPEVKYIIIYKKDLDRIGENMNYFKLEKQIGTYYIYRKL